MGEARHARPGGRAKPVRTIWTERAERLLEKALGMVRDGVHDVIPTVDAAMTALRIEAGELPEDEMDGYFDEDNEGEA